MEVVGVNVKVGKELRIEDVDVGFFILGKICSIFKNKNALTKIKKINKKLIQKRFFPSYFYDKKFFIKSLIIIL